MPKLLYVLMLATFAFAPPLAGADQLSPANHPGSTVNVADFGVKPNTGEDATLGVLRALEVCRTIKNPVLIFPKGSYQFYPDQARERYYAIANNWHQMQRVALPLWDFDGLSIDGQGSDFIMHGMIIPVVIDGSKNVTIKNFSVDWQRPSLSQGEVVDSDKTHFDLRIPGEYPYKTINGELIFMDGTTEYPLRDFLEFDPRIKAPAFQAQDAAGAGRPNNVESRGNGTVRFTFVHPMRTPPKVGNIVVLRGGMHRFEPAIFGISSQNIWSANVNIYTACGMGFVAQRCENITLTNTDVRVREGSDRLFTCDADATHFVYCRGQILLENCLFENQLDDAGNTHGIYSRIEEKINDHTLLMRLAHPEQVGVEVVAPGEHIRFVDNHTMQAYASATVKTAKWLNVDFFLLTTAEKIPAEMQPHNVIENLDWQPDLAIINCTTRRNRARGFLIGTSGRVLIEGNTMEEPGACLSMGVDANNWFESGLVKDVTIRNNHFIDPNYGVWGKAAIDLDGGLRRSASFEKNIIIEKNDFKLFNISVLEASSIAGLRFVNNTLERTTTYPQTQKPPMAAVSIHGCREVKIANNKCLAVPENEQEILIDGEVVGRLGDTAAISIK